MNAPQDKPVRVRATLAEVKRLRAEVEALRAAVTWVAPLFIAGQPAAQIVERVAYLNQDIERFDRASAPALPPSEPQP